MENIETLERDIFETEAKAEGLQEALLESRVHDLTDLVTKGGKLKGHLKGITPAQFRAKIGRAASPSIIGKAKGETQRKIPYELSIDQLMSERGYNDIEKFKDAIEKAHQDKAEIERLWRDRDIMINDLQAELSKTPELESKVFRITRECPVFPANECNAIVTQMDGTTVTERRQHPFWRIDVDLDGDGIPDHTFQVRYAKDAHKLVRATKEQIMESEDLLYGESTPRMVRVKRRQPKLRIKRRTPAPRYIGLISPRR